MPQVAAAWGLSGIWAAVVGYTLEVAVAAAASYAATKLTADNFDTGFNLDTQTSGNQIPIRVVYGLGTMAGVEAFKSSAKVDNDNFDLHYALVLAGHECEDITDVWLDETFAAAGVDLDWANNRIGGGKFDPDGTHNACHFWKHLGTSTQTVDAELNGVYSSKWTTNHRLRGIAYVAARYRLYSKTQDLFGAGPPTARFRVKGYKVYDPRLDSTQPGGSGSQRIATPSTWAWSQSPPLCLAHFLCFSEWGPLWDSAWIDWPSFMAAATYCDTTVSIPGSTTEPRFKCNGVLNAGDQHLDNVKKILGCFRGALVPAGDKWRVIAGYQAADLTLTEKDLADTLTMDTESSLIDRFNTVKVTYVDPDNNDVQNEVGGITDATYVARDGGYVLPRQLSIPLCTGFYQAQRLGTLELKLGNQQKVVNFPGNLRALQALAAERVALNIVEWGFSNKNMIVENFEFQDFDGVSLQLREDSSSAYDDMLVGSYSTRGANGVLTPGDETVAAPTSLSATGDLGGNRIKWTNPTVPFDTILVWASPSSAWSGAVLVFKGLATEFFHSVSTQQWYWVQAQRLSTLSLRLPDSNTSTVTATPLAAPEPGATVGGPSTANYLPSWVSDFESIMLDDLFTNTTFGVASAPYIVDRTAAYLGKTSLAIGLLSDFVTPNQFGIYLTGGEYSTGSFQWKRNLFIPPNRRWVFICAMQLSSGFAGYPYVQYHVELKGVGDAVIASDVINVAESTGAWMLVCFDLDLTASSETVAYSTIYGKVISNPGGAISARVDAAQLLDVTDAPWIVGGNQWVVGSSPAPTFPTNFVMGGGSAAGRSLIRTKPSNTSRTSSTLLPDAHLQAWSLEKARSYVLEGVFYFTAGTTPNFKCRLACTSAPQAIITAFTGVDGGGAAINTTTTNWNSADFVVNGGAGQGIVRFTATILGHATNTIGMDFSWAPNTTNTPGATLNVSSWAALKDTTYGN